jgi:hypothetical protein
MVDALQTKIDLYSREHENVLLLSSDELTEDLIRYFATELDDDTLDQMDVLRHLVRRDDLASEPVTACVLIGLGGTAVVVVGRMIERWIEMRRQAEHLAVVVEGFRVSDEAGRTLADLAARHAEVSIEYTLADPGSGLHAT